MSPEISRDEWLSALGSAAQPCDPDALTVAEISEQFGISQTSAYRRIRGLVKAGRAVSTFKTITMVNGIDKRVPAYRLVKATNEARPAARRR